MVYAAVKKKILAVFSAGEACCCSDGSVHDFAALIAHHSVLLSGNGNCDGNISK